MAADLHIHTMEGVTEYDLQVFFSHSLGSKWFDITTESDCFGPEWKAVTNSPSVWVCEVSWLKAGLLDDDSYIPDLAAEITNLIREDLPIIDDDLIHQVKQIFNRMKQHEFYEQTDETPVLEFLEQHKGQRTFTVSW